VTTRKQQSESVRGGGGRSWWVVCVAAVGAGALALVALGVYRYRRCYEGSYDIDAELAIN